MCIQFTAKFTPCLALFIMLGERWRYGNVYVRVLYVC